MRFNNARRAFSLIEIMIVVVIIGLMAGVVTLATTGYLERAKKERARSDIATYATALDSYYLQKGKFPDTQEGLKVLVPDYIKALQAYYTEHLADPETGEPALCADCRRRLEKNPLRLLDCKVPSCQPIAEEQTCPFVP